MTNFVCLKLNTQFQNNGITNFKNITILIGLFRTHLDVTYLKVRIIFVHYLLSFYSEDK